MGRTPGELAEVLTARELALFQAAVEIDGPFWGAREAAYMRQLTSVNAAAAGASVSPDELEIEWRVGGPGETGGPNLLDPADGLSMFAAMHGRQLSEVPA